MEQMAQIHTNDAQFNGTAIEGKQLLTAEDLLHMQIEDDPFMLSELNLCTVCSWTSSEF